MWQAGKSAELSKKIMERSEEAKTIEVPFKDTNINLYEIAKYNVGLGVYFEKRSPEGLEVFRAEFPQSILIDDTYTALTNIYLRLPVSSESNAFFEDVIEKYPDDPRMLNSYAWFWALREKNLKSALKTIKKGLDFSSPFCILICHFPF